MNFPGDLMYTKDHEWIRVEGGSATIGITEYAQGELGDVVFVQLPSAGTGVKQGAAFGTIEAVKAVSDLFAPASGTITEINRELEGAPQLVNQDPYGAGWMVRLALSNPAELSSLMTVDQYKASIGK